MEFVHLDSLGIWAARGCVSVGLYAQFSGTPPSPDGVDAPATGISWDDAARFCRWMNDTVSDPAPGEGLFRLPMAAEWAVYTGGQAVSGPLWGEECPPFGTEADFERVRLRAAPAGVAPVACEVERPGDLMWEWTGDLFDPAKNCRILRGACWRGLLDGAEAVVYHRTPHSNRGRPEVAFRVVWEGA